MKINKTFLTYSGVVIIGILGLSFGAYAYIKSTPQYSLYETYLAIKNRNYDSFSKYVDVNSVIDNTIDKLLSQQNNPTNPNDKTAQELTKGIVQLFRGTIKDAATREIQKSIEQGSLIQPNQVGSSSPNILLNADIKRNGSIATVSLFLENGKQVSLQMRWKGSYWQIFNADLDSLGIGTNMLNAPTSN